MKNIIKTINNFCDKSIEIFENFINEFFSNEYTLITIGLICIIIFLFCSTTNEQKKYIEQTNINIKLQEELTTTKKTLEETEKNLEDTIKERDNYADITFTDIQNLMSYIEPLKTLDKKEYLKQYDNIISYYSNIYDRDETLEDYYAYEEIYMMQRCIETETYGADIDSKINVASVILNRIDSDKFPNTPIGVVTQPSQFTYGRTEISDDTKIALEYAFRIEDTTNGSLYFHSNAKTEKFNGANHQLTDKAGHHFYK